TRRWAVAAGGALALASLATVPRAWGAKQDYPAAIEYVERARGAEDAVVVVDMTILPYRDHWKLDWLVARDVRALRGIEAAHARTWLVYTFPASLEAIEPAIWERVRTEYREAAVFHGTVSGGDVIVTVSG
ncbi:MAG: hypothetical protein ACRELC_03310, partial [Gemmatimonadota bacterium]